MRAWASTDLVITSDVRFVYSGLRGKPADGVAGYAVQANSMFEPLGRTAAAFKIKDDGSLETEATLRLGNDFWDILVLDVGAEF